MSTGESGRAAVIVADHGGYSSHYRTGQGEPFLPASGFAVRLVTDLEGLADARGEELESVVGVPGDDERALAEAVRYLYACGGRRAVRLVAVSERLLLPAARLRQELGIAGPTLSDITPFRDKIAMKEYLRARGVRVPVFAPFSAAAVLGLLRSFPAVVAKPRLGLGARDVFVLRSEADVRRLLSGRPQSLGTFEVEEYVDGPLYHVDSVVRRGTVVAAVAGRYLDAPTSYRQLQPCRDVAVAAGAVLDKLLDFNAQVVSCFPEHTGVTHHELWLTSDGACLCEIAARPGGGGVPAGFRSRTGLDLRQIAVRAQLDPTDVPAAASVAGHLTGWVAIYASPGVLASPITVPDAPWVIESQVTVRPGDRLPAAASCADRVATVTVTGATEAEVTSRLALVTAAAAPDVAAEPQDTARHLASSDLEV